MVLRMFLVCFIVANITTIAARSLSIRQNQPSNATIMSDSHRNVYACLCLLRMPSLILRKSHPELFHKTAAER